MLPRKSYSPVSRAFSKIHRFLSRYPREPALAFPSPKHRWGVQNAYIQTLADLGLAGLALLAAAVAAALWLGLRGAGRSAAALVGVCWLLVALGVWNGLGLVAGIPLDALTWLAFGLVTLRE